MFCVFVLCAATRLRSTIVLRDGASYSGQCMRPNSGRSHSLTAKEDTVTLRNGKVYAGQYNGAEYVAFRDGQGIDYNLPLRDLETIIFIQNSAPPAATIGVAVVIPRGSEIVVRNGETIDSEYSSTGHLFSAVVSEDVPDGSGGIAIPRVHAQDSWSETSPVAARSTARSLPSIFFLWIAWTAPMWA